jgi:uncharacterized protein (DUF1684 family)
MRPNRVVAAGAIAAALAGSVHAAAPLDPAYAAELSAWRAKADESLRRERGWLSIIGRWELEPGANRIGAAPGNQVVLPKALAPATLGTVTVTGDKVRLSLAPGQKMQSVEDGKPAFEFTERELLAGDGRLEWVTAGRLSLQFVRRDDGKFVLRAADRDAPILKTFAGRVWYDPKADYRVPARFVAQPKGTKIPIANVRGEIGYEEVAGHLEFELDGATVKLDALDDDGDLFIIFRDATSAKTTYGAGRFLAIARPKDGVWYVDFNKAYNPPCAFSAYTTCPLPPPQNWLKTAVPAGERYVERKS